MTGSELLSALTPVIDALEAMGVGYYVGGSLASSTHGVPRASIDADVVADLEPAHVAPFLARVRSDYYVDEGRLQHAVATRRSFNLIHLGTMFKIDVFAAKRGPFEREALCRARSEALEEGPNARALRVASAEDTVLAKLEWFRAGFEAWERQWSDVVGVLKIRGPAIEGEYLTRWAAALGVGDLLERARAEAEPAS